MAVIINLSRSHGDQSWGFRLAGGLDFGQQLSVKKVGVFFFIFYFFCVCLPFFFCISFSFFVSFLFLALF